MCEKVLDKLKETTSFFSKGFVEAQLSAPNGIVTYRPSGMKEALYLYVYKSCKNCILLAVETVYTICSFPHQICNYAMFLSPIKEFNWHLFVACYEIIGVEYS